MPSLKKLRHTLFGKSLVKFCHNVKLILFNTLKVISFGYMK